MKCFFLGLLTEILFYICLDFKKKNGVHYFFRNN